jgi:DNA-binding response OmpR family regulator
VGGTLELGPIQVDIETHQAAVGGSPMSLTVTEFKLLAALISAGGKVLSRPALISRAMGPGVTVTERTIDVHITSIRKKLGEAAPILQTVRGVGYRAAIPEYQPGHQPEQTADA